jgi:hypothetical protein
MTLPAAREQETTQQPGDIIVGAPAASEVSMPPSDPTQMVNHHEVAWFARGSPEGPDKDRPSMAAEEYMDTQLPVRAQRPVARL